jgi:WD40 repeat protein
MYVKRSSVQATGTCASLDLSICGCVVRVWVRGCVGRLTYFCSFPFLCTRACSADEVFCVTGTATGKLYVWEICTGRMVGAVETAHYREISVLRFSNDGAYVLSGSEDATVRVWRLSRLLERHQAGAPETSTPFHTWADHTLPVTDIVCGSVNVRIYPHEPLRGTTAFRTKWFCGVHPTSAQNGFAGCTNIRTKWFCGVYPTSAQNGFAGCTQHPRSLC